MQRARRITISAGDAQKIVQHADDDGFVAGRLQLFIGQRLGLVANSLIRFLASQGFAALIDVDELALAFVRLIRSEEHTSELQSQSNLVCRLLLEKKKKV